MTDPSTDKMPEELSKPQSPSLLRRVLKGASWTLGGHLISQGIRLGSNLILSRLLFPEAFGLMALVYTFLSGLTMLSDTGTNLNIVQSKRGDDQAFLNTAWTVDCIRGIVLWLLACVISVPAASFYQEPILMALLPVVGLTLIISGFNSNKVVIANRNLDLKRVTILNLTVQILSILITLVGAWVANAIDAPRDTAVWALVLGNLTGSTTYLIMSYTYFPGKGNRFQLEREALGELFRFGRWIFLSTLLTFFAFQGSNLIIPRLLGVAFLGIYSFASNLSQVASTIVSMIGDRVLFPSYAELHRDRPERLYRALRRARISLLAVHWAIALFLIFFGQPLINIMYDSRYADAGWMLQILALGSLVSILESTYSNVLLAQGKSFLLTVMMVMQMTFQIIGIFAGYHLGREFGLLVGLAFAGWAVYPFQAVIYSRVSIWQPEVDLPVIALASALAVYVFAF